MILLFLFNISSISRIVFIVLTSKFVVEIQNLFICQDLYNLEPYGSNIAICSNIGIFLPWLGQVLRIYRFLLLANSCFICKSLVILNLVIFLVILIILIIFKSSIINVNDCTTLCRTTRISIVVTVYKYKLFNLPPPGPPRSLRV